jgi:uncharacterized membrane protein HdeD (DUF308 family)
MREYLTHYWWVLAARGLMALAFATMILGWPAATVLAISVIFGLYVLSDGIVAGATAVKAPADARLALFAEALTGILFGVVSLVWPDVTLRVITILVGLWAIVTGLGEIAIATLVRRAIPGESMYVVFGAVSILYGLVVALAPVHGAIAVAWLIGIGGGVYGIAMVAAAFELKVLVTGEPPPG